MYSREPHEAKGNGSAGSQVCRVEDEFLPMEHDGDYNKNHDGSQTSRKFMHVHDDDDENEDNKQQTTMTTIAAATRRGQWEAWNLRGLHLLRIIKGQRHLVREDLHASGLRHCGVQRDGRGEGGHEADRRAVGERRTVRPLHTSISGQNRNGVQLDSFSERYAHQELCDSMGEVKTAEPIRIRTKPAVGTRAGRQFSP
jgi:hypothetical protein